MTSAVKHTPGPWITFQPRGDGSVPVRTDGLGLTICYVHDGAICDAIANARLIAAAPDLLAALKDLLEAYSKPDERLCCDGRDCGCMGSTVHQQAEHYARAAIAKAETRP